MGYKHKKKFGQNFLKNKKVLINIIDSIDVTDKDLILEIGPGQGALTKYLKLFNCNIRCYEVDSDLKVYLDSFEDEKTSIVFKDFLSVNVEEDIKDIKYNNLYVVANLPYYITTPILDKIINTNINVKEMVLMVQKEVAYRFAAKPGTKDYGAITAILNSYFDIKLLFEVSRKEFVPEPNVDSAVIKFKSNENSEKIANRQLFNRLVRDAFRMKRKNIKNNLSNYDIDLINNILGKYGLSVQDRAEQVPLECFIEISNSMN